VEVKHYVQAASANALTLDTLYEIIKKVVRKYIDSNDFHTSIITVSIIFTYYQDRVGTTHYLFFVGPPNCGKTNNLTLFEEMAYRCMSSSGLTAPNMYEFLGGKEEGMGTIAEDEADDIDENRDKMKVYKNGSRKGKPYLRIDTSSGRNQGKFYTFCFKAAAAERLPDAEKAGGLMQRIIAINCRAGDPQYDISEVINPMGDDGFDGLRQELNHIHKLLLVYRLLHYHKKIPDIYTNLKNREKQLFKPILRIFQGSRTQEALRLILTNFVNVKRRENVDSLLAFLYDRVKEIVDKKKAQQVSSDVLVPFQAIWELIIDPIVNPGKLVSHKPNSYDSDEFGIFTKKEIGAKLRVLGGEPPKHKGTKRGWVFSEDTMVRLSKLYGDDTEITISLTKPTTEMAGFGADGADKTDPGDVGGDRT
jgi:hypothetical protein